jgi:hypothetical protein
MGRNHQQQGKAAYPHRFPSKQHGRLLSIASEKAKVEIVVEDLYSAVSWATRPVGRKRRAALTKVCDFFTREAVYWSAELPARELARGMCHQKRSRR